MATRNNKIIKPTLYMSLALILFCMTCTSAFQVSGNFKHCTLNDNSPFVNMYESCHTFETHTTNLNAKVSILEKRLHEIDGYGYECFKAKITTTTRETWTGNHITDRNEEIIKVSKEECNIMIQYKRCEKEKMYCKQDMCEYNQQKVLEWSYMREITVNRYRCTLRKKLLINKDADTTLFREKPDCTINKFVCQLHSSTIVWTSDILHPCPYNLVLETKLNISNQIAISESNNLFLQLTSSSYSIKCNITLIGTTEGLYITKDKIPTNLIKIKLDLEAKTHLTLSDSDYKNYNLYTIISKLNKADNERICEMNKQLLRLYERRTNEFLITADKHLKPMIVYNLEGEIIETKCVDVKEIIIHELNNDCYENAQVSIISEKRLIKAYLGQDGIISNYKILRDCKVNKRILLPKSKSYIRLINNKVYKNEAKNEISVIFKEETKEFNLQHISQIVEDYDMLQVKQQQEIINTDIKSFHIQENNNDNFGNNVDHMVKYIENKYTNVKNTTLTIIIIMGIATTLSLIYKVYKFTKRSECLKKSPETEINYHRQQEEITFIPTREEITMTPSEETHKVIYNNENNKNTLNLFKIEEEELNESLE